MIHLRITNHPHCGALVFCGLVIPPERSKAETVSDAVIGTDAEGFRGQYINSEYPRDYDCEACRDAFLESSAAVDRALMKAAKLKL